MGAKNDDPAAARRQSITDDASLDRALRELYDQYGSGDLPPHLVELAERLEAARAAIGTAEAGPSADAPAGRPGQERRDLNAGRG